MTDSMIDLPAEGSSHSRLRCHKARRLPFINEVQAHIAEPLAADQKRKEQAILTRAFRGEL